MKPPIEYRKPHISDKRLKAVLKKVFSPISDSTVYEAVDGEKFSGVHSLRHSDPSATILAHKRAIKAAQMKRYRAKAKDK